LPGGGTGGAITLNNTGVLGVNAGSGILLGGTSQNPTIGINTALVPQLGTVNTFTAQQNINAKEIIAASSSYEVVDVTQSGGTGDGIRGSTNSSTGNGVVGNATANSGTTAGVLGTTASSTGYGVNGTSPNVGVYGQADGASETGEGVATAGVWGDTGGSSSLTVSYVGVVGTADDNDAAYFVNNSSGDATVFIQNGTKSSLAPLLVASGPEVGGQCTIDVSGDLTCSGTVSGAVSADNGTRKLSVYSMQSAENWFEDAGSGQLTNGHAIVALDPAFASTVNAGVEYHVFLTPKGDCQGLYVTNENPQGFEVHELRGGRSSIAFDYRIMAKRAGYENVRLEDVTERYQKMQQQQQQRRERIQQRRASRTALAPVTAGMTQHR
jgi:hypothetical protein